MAIRQRAEDDHTGLLSCNVTFRACRGLKKEASLTLRPLPKPETEDQTMTEEFENVQGPVADEQINLKSYVSPPGL